MTRYDADFFAALRWIRGKPAITKELQTDKGRILTHIGDEADRAALTRVLSREPKEIPAELLQALASAFQSAGASPMRAELVLVRRQRGAPKKGVALALRDQRLVKSIEKKKSAEGKNRKRSSVHVHEEAAAEHRLGRSAAYVATAVRKRRADEEEK